MNRSFARARQIRFVIAMLIFSCVAVRGGGNPGSEIEDLLIDFPRPDEIREMKMKLSSPDVTLYGKAQTTEKLAVVPERIPKILALLRVGDNVFDYPGLIAAGVTTFRPATASWPIRYLLTLGGKTKDEEIDTPPMIEVAFDAKGKITSVSTPGKLPR